MAGPNDTIIITGRVERGDRRSREIGFPTANLTLCSQAVQHDGMWAGIVTLGLGGRTVEHVAAISVGRVSASNSHHSEHLLGAYLLDFKGDLYGREIAVTLHTRLRPSRTHPDAASHRKQVQLDINATRAWAAANALDRLLNRTPKNVRGAASQLHKRARRNHDNQERISIRRSRNDERIQAFVCNNPEILTTPEAIAASTGIPIGYIRWRLPALTPNKVEPTSAGDPHKLASF
ncbi:riboflavin kinase [Paenarthrobacter nicotinovorans]|uniref:riboflavin kinase n=1 Tax=Paenarthrobacter nicotinovorans TaxID=29320 RepID=UPI003815B7B4